MSVEQNNDSDTWSIQLGKEAEIAFKKAEELYTTGQHPLAITAAEAAIGLYQRLENKEKILDLKTMISQCYLLQNKIEQASAYLENLLEEAIQILGPIHTCVASAYSNLGYLHSVLLQDIEQGIFFDQKSLDTRLKIEGINPEIIARSYNNLGFSYGRMEDHNRQFIYLQKALSICQEIYPNLRDHVTEIYDNLSNYHLTLKEYDKAIEHQKIALNIRKETLGESHYLVCQSYINLGECYKEKGEVEKGLEYQKMGLEGFKAILPENHTTLGSSFWNIAHSYNVLENWDLAIDYLEKSWKTYEKTYVGTHISKAGILDEWAKALIGQSKTEEAMQKIQQALLQLLKVESATTEDIRFIYPITSFKNYSVTLIDTLKTKAQLWVSYAEKISHNDKDLELAVSHYLSASKVIDAKRQSYKTEKSKLLHKHLSVIYEEGIETMFRIEKMSDIDHIWESAFLFAEKAKATVLLSIMNDVSAKLKAQLPAELLSKERKLKGRLTFLDKFIQKYKEDESKQQLLKKYKEEFFEYQQIYLQFLQQLEIDYPDYYQLKYNTKTVTPIDLQSTLDENQALISYFVSQKSIYIFVVTPDEFEVEELEKPNGFEEMIEQFLEAIHLHNQSIYLQLAHELYELLIAPVELHWYNPLSLLVEEESNEAKQHLIIIPHAELSYVPFEALISEKLKVKRDEKVAYQNAHYLVQEYEISYHYSATLWQYAQANKGGKAETEQGFVGFAPIYQSEKANVKTQETLTAVANDFRSWATRSEALRSDGAWTPLPHSKEEAENIAALFEQKGLDASTYLYEKATKEEFQEAVGKARYLLVAAHGVVNDEKTALSGLVFYPDTVNGGRWTADGGRQTVDGSRVSNEEHRTLNHEHRTLNSEYQISNPQSDCILSMEETYPLNINADLVVLSSCESGIGKLHKGEGMMAVNRGFLAAGAKNVISTLFKVYDKPSSLLTQYLFEGILEGDSYRMALRKAKLKLMELEGVSPKSWCGFVLIGG